MMIKLIKITIIFSLVTFFITILNKGVSAQSCGECQYPETCTTANGQPGVRECDGVRVSGVCVYSDACGPSCNTCRLSSEPPPPPGSSCSESFCAGRSEPDCWGQAGSGCGWFNGACSCNSSNGARIEGSCSSFRNVGNAPAQVSIAQCRTEYWPDKTKAECLADANKGVGCPSSTITLNPGDSYSLNGTAHCGIWQVDAAGAGWSCADTGCNWDDTTCSILNTPTPQPIAITGKVYCQDDNSTPFPIANASISIYKAGTDNTVTVTTGSDGSFTSSAFTNESPFAVRSEPLPTAGTLSNGQPYSQLSGPTALNCNNTAATTCTLSDPNSTLCGGNVSYENCALTTGNHENFDFKYTNCTPQVFACSGITPTTSDFSRGSTYTFTCQGSGNAAKTANFRVVLRTSTQESVLKTSDAPITLDQTLKAEWQYTIPLSAAAGNYAVQCQICNASNQCTNWGRAN